LNFELLSNKTLVILNELRRKREAREAHSSSAFAQKVHGIRAKLYNKKRHAEKIEMKKK
jgi:ribosome biogenesis protein NSA2